MTKRKVSELCLKDAKRQVDELAAEQADRAAEVAVAADRSKAKEGDEKATKASEERQAEVAKAAEAAMVAQAERSTPSPGFTKVAIEVDGSSSSDDDASEGGGSPTSVAQQNKAAAAAMAMAKAAAGLEGVSPDTVKALGSLLEGGGGAEGLLEEMLSGGSAMAALESLNELGGGLPSRYKLVDDLLGKALSGEGGGGGTTCPLEALALLLVESKEARIHLRTSGGLRRLCCRLCGGGLATPRTDVGAIAVRPDGEGFDLDDVVRHPLAGLLACFCPFLVTRLRLPVSACPQDGGAAQPDRPDLTLDPDPARTIGCYV